MAARLEAAAHKVLPARPTSRGAQDPHYLPVQLELLAGSLGDSPGTIIPTYRDLEDVSPLLKNVYLKVRKKAFPIMTPLVAAATKGSPERVRFAGNDLFFPVKLGRRGGVVSSGLGYLPDSQVAEEAQGRLGIARTYARLAVDRLGATITEDPRGAFLGLAAKLTEDVMEEWKLTQERVLQGDGLGVYAIIDSVTDTDTIVVDNPYGIADAGPGNLHLVPGDTISVRDSTGATHRGKAKISSISVSGDLATLELASTIAGMTAGDLVCVGVPAATHATDDSFAAEPFGIKAFVDVEGNYATFQSINHSRWVANKLTSSTVDATVVMRLLNTIRARAGIDWRSSPKKLQLHTSTGIWQKYGEGLLGLQRFAAPKMELDGGFNAVSVAGAALVDDPWGPRGRIYAIYTPDTVFVDLMDFGQLSYKDAPVWSRAADQDSFESAYATYWGYGLFNRISQGVISGISDSTSFAPVF